MALIVHQLVPPLASLIRNPYFLKVNCGAVIERILGVLVRYRQIPREQIRLSGLYHPHGNQAVFPKDIARQELLEQLPPDRVWFVFDLDSEYTRPTDITVVHLDMYTYLWSGETGGSTARWLIVGYREPTLQLASSTTLAMLFCGVQMFITNYRKRRWHYPQALARGNASYKNYTISQMRDKYYRMTIWQAIDRVPYYHWFFVADMWTAWPNLIGQTMIDDFSATYFSQYLTHEGQVASAMAGLSLGVKDLISPTGGASSSVDSLAEYISYSAYQAEETDVADCSDFTLNDCESNSSAAWPLLVGSTGEEFALRKASLLDRDTYVD